MKAIMGFLIVGGLIAVAASTYAKLGDADNSNGKSAQPATHASDTDKASDDTADSEQSAEANAPHETQWVSHYGDYYVNCYVTGGIRWYTAINQSNLTDARVNQTPDDEMWSLMCGRR